eukprot:gene2539-3289_t
MIIKDYYHEWEYMCEQHAGGLDLADGEEMVDMWHVDMGAGGMALKEYFYTLITAGLYVVYKYCIATFRTQVWLCITSYNRVIFREEFHNRRASFHQNFFQAQVAFKLPQLAYVRYELVPASLSSSSHILLDLHFEYAPRCLASSSYQSFVGILVGPIVAIITESLDEATGGMYTLLKESANNGDPEAMLKAACSTFQSIAQMASNPLKIVQDFLMKLISKSMGKLFNAVYGLFGLFEALREAPGSYGINYKYSFFCRAIVCMVQHFTGSYCSAL